MKKVTFDYKKITGWLKNIVGHRRGLIPTEGVWLVLLVVFLILNIVIIVLSFVLFLRISGDDIFAIRPQETQPTETLSRNEIEELIRELKVREQKFEALTEEQILPIEVISEDSEDTETQEGGEQGTEE